MKNIILNNKTVDKIGAEMLCTSIALLFDYLKLDIKHMLSLSSFASVQSVGCLANTHSIDKRTLFQSYIHI